jgi:N-acetylglutamate synthase
VSDEAALAWRIEEACLNAWPAVREVFLDGWLLRFAPGVSRRSNSANPLRAAPADSEALIDACERLFAAQGTDPLFRMASIVSPAIEARLDRRGYRAEGCALTLYAPLEAVRREAGAQVVRSARPDAAWLAAMTRMKARDAAEHAIYARCVEALAVPSCFASVAVDGTIASMAYGALHEGLLVMESVVTDEAFRGRGLALAVLSSLAEWAEREGGAGVCLQVASDNAPGLALYRRFGMTRSAYTYRYRRGVRRAG